MTAISDLVSYEREYPLKLKHPGTGEDLGITFWVRHIDCDDAIRATKISAAQIMGDPDAEEPKENAAYAACITRWDWGENEFLAGKGAPEFSPEMALEVMHHANTKWIVAQVRAAVVKIGNFIND